MLSYVCFSDSGSNPNPMIGKRGGNMATSSITDNFTISEAKAARAFTDALVRASRSTVSRRRIVTGHRVVGREAVRSFLSQVKHAK